MWSVIWFFMGCCRARITGASPEWALNKLSQARIAFRDMKKTDDFTIELLLPVKDILRAQAVCTRAMCQLEEEKRYGFRQIFGGLFHRPVLHILLSLAAAAAIAVPKFVFFYTVTGNERVPSELILRTLDELGVGVGAYGPSIKPQAIKNKILCRIPELKWITIQQSGMRATVVVREREAPEPVYVRKAPRNVIASHAGMLTRVSVLAGNSLCKVGDSVTQGQLLVSAYTDLGYKTQVSGALAEIYAKTWRKSQTVTPQTELQKLPTGQTRKHVSLRIGSRRITLYGAGAGAVDCDKQTQYHQFALPGGIFLPVGIEITQISDYDTIEKGTDEAQARELLRACARQQEMQDMIAGEILGENLVYACSGGVYSQYAQFTCEEMIARSVDAEIFKDD